MSQFLHDDDDYNGNVKAIAIPPVFSENSRANLKTVLSTYYLVRAYISHALLTISNEDM